MKKIQLLAIISSFLISVWGTNVYAQSPKQLIGEIQQLLVDHYIFLDKAEAMNKRLDQGLESAEFDGIEREEDLAVALTKAMQDVLPLV